ncbi:UNVERIFIED_CONTAM: hypothetical protein Sangu_2060400 [Sesamum angustifolium]|uniref:Uncharacterized protein n=1 Tax=Sesamum angustifolium TaxID=2727405 RepID=A0AAW2LK38_9LAMI
MKIYVKESAFCPPRRRRASPLRTVQRRLGGVQHPHPQRVTFIALRGRPTSSIRRCSRRRSDAHWCRSPHWRGG